MHQWSSRRDLCRRISLQLGLSDTVEVEDFATLQRLCVREGYRRVIVPGTMYVSPEVILWLRTQGIRLHDALSMAR